MVGAQGVWAYLAVSIVLQSIDPEADIADVAAWIEICKRSNPSWLPIETLQRRQPGIPTAATTPVSELPRHCMRSPSVQQFAASMHAWSAAGIPQTSRHTIGSPSVGGLAVAGSSHTARAVGKSFDEFPNNTQASAAAHHGSKGRYSWPAAYSRPATISSLVRYPLQADTVDGPGGTGGPGGGGGGSRGVIFAGAASCPLGGEAACWPAERHLRASLVSGMLALSSCAQRNRQGHLARGRLWQALVIKKALSPQPLSRIL